jgi:outer membrane protein
MAWLVMLTSCEFFYDPVRRGDVPPSQGETWDNVSFIVKKTAETPYHVSDLSGTMTLSRLLDIALYNNPSTRASWNAARASAYAHRASLSAYYPTIDYQGSLNVISDKGGSVSNSGVVIPANSTVVDFQNNLSLSYLLLDFGGRAATAELALQTLYASDWQHNLTMQQVMLSVLNAYTSYLGNQGLVQAYERDLKDAQLALNASQLMRKNGLSTLSDVLLAQSTLATAQTNLIQAQGSENTSLAEILIALGLPADTQLSIENLPQELPVIEISGTISELLELSKRKRPDLGIAIAAIKQQQAQLAISYSNSMPMLTTNLDYTRTNFLKPKNLPGTAQVASLDLTYPIFQGFFFMNQQRQLRAQIQEALANLDVQVATVSTQVVTAYYSLKAAEAALPSSEAALEYSQRAFRGFVIQYKTGASSMLDLLNALTALSNARSQEVLTRTQWAASLASLAFAVGALEDHSGLWEKAPPKALYQVPIKDDGGASEK